jgi:hypothetical protein
MYMPRLRARQHEVLSVIQGAGSFASNGKVVPVLEPVATLNDLFVRRMNKISSAGLACDLVLNPSVGIFRDSGDWRRVADFYLAEGLIGPHNIAVLSNAEADHAAMSSWIASARAAGLTFNVDVVHELDLSISLTGSTYGGVRWNVAEDRTVPAAYGLPLSGRPVVWSHDPFPSLQANREYVGRAEGIFTTRATTYASAGYVGVSDYLTVGKSFRTGGGPAYAVVIHLTYVVAGVVRLRHFCSDTNETQDDPGGKFLEALDKLVSFAAANRLPANPGLDQFVSLHGAQHFPGLGKVKELSILNHMFVMQGLV